MKKQAGSGRNAAVIVAAGFGKRMDGNIPKQYICIGGKPVLIHSIENFERASGISEIILVVEKSRVEEILKDIVEQCRFKKVVSVIAGGKIRQESVYNGIKAVSGGVETISIQDGARPFTPVRMIEECITQALLHGAAAVAYPVRDTVKRVSGGRFTETLDRKNIYLIQTPQTFRTELIREAHEKAKMDGYIGTDDTALVERLGASVVAVEGSPYNLKITYADDLASAEALVGTIQTFYLWSSNDAESRDRI